MRPSIDGYLSAIQTAVLQIRPDDVEAIVSMVFDAYLDARQVFTLGNGASAALASHMACDLGKGTAVDLGRGPQAGALPRLRIISLNDNAALMTAYSNDIDYADMFAEQLKNLLRPGDVVIGISASGGSPNVLRAMTYARLQDARTIGLTGSQPSAGMLAELCDICLHAPVQQIEQIEDLHVIVHHIVSVMLRARIADHLLAGATLEHDASHVDVGIANGIAAQD